MNDSNEQKPAGYGHDKKGAAGGTAKNEGRVHVAHKAHAARLGACAAFACARSGEWRHPVVGLWPLALREDLRQRKRKHWRRNMRGSQPSKDA
jgi:hypothetical protein